MRVWDSELLTQNGENMPVTDGLLVSLDALDFIDHTTNFTDRITGNIIVPNDTKIHRITRVDNVLSVDCIKTTSGQTKIDFSSVQELVGVKCVDFTFKSANSNVIDGRIRFGEYNNSVIDCGIYNNNYLTFDGIMHHYTICMDGSSLYVYTDGALSQTVSNSKVPYNTYTFLTTYCAYREIKHLYDLGSLRVYSFMSMLRNSV